MSLRAIPVRCIAIDHVVGALLPALTPAQRDAYKRRRERGESAPSIIAKMLWWLEAGAPAPGSAPEPPAAAAGTRGGMLMQHAGQLGRAGNGSCNAAAVGMHQQAAAAAAAAAGYAGALGAQGPAAAHEAAMAAAMTAAAAAASAAQFSAGLPGQLHGMSLSGAMGMGHGMPAGSMGLAGLGGGRIDMLPHAALREASLTMADPMAAYHAALHSMQSAAALQSAMPGPHSAFLGAASGYPQLGGLMGM
jgi:hypothetical protein